MRVGDVVYVFAPANRWNHSICNKCWDRQNPDRQAHTVSSKYERCCFCGYIHNSGIYVRKDPATIVCKAVHGARGTENQKRDPGDE
jgi:hypothetical protein